MRLILKTPKLTVDQILFARFSITLILSSAYMYSAGTADFPWGAKGVRSLLFLRGFFGFFGIYSAYCTSWFLKSRQTLANEADSLRFLPLAEAVVIGFLAPLLTAYATSMILHSTFSSRQTVGGITAFLGVVIIADPFSLYGSVTSMIPDDPSGRIPFQLETIPSVSSFYRSTAIVLGVFSALATACGFTTIRLVGDRAHVLIQVNYYSMVSTIISGLTLLLPIPPLPFLGDTSFCLPSTLREWILLVHIGVSGFILQFLMTAGLQADSSSRATNMMYSQIIFALCLDWGIWGRVPGWGSAIGGAVVVGAVIWSSTGKTEAKKENYDEYTAIGMDEDEIELQEEHSITV